MLFSFELVPPKANIEKLLKRIEPIINLVDAFNITDTPLGMPRIPSVIFASILLQRFNVKTIVHLKTINMNKIALKSVIYGCAALGIYGVLVVRGDKPSEGSEVSDTWPEELVLWGKSDEKTASLKLGMVAGPPLDIQRLSKKLSAKPDFMITQVMLSIESAKNFYQRLLDVFTMYGWRPQIYVNLVVPTEKNSEIIKEIAKLAGIPMSNNVMMKIDEFRNIVDELGKIYDGILLSSPMDLEGGVEFIKFLRG
ncbi:MAG: methylenetetrahydrofolate reductase [Thermoprotei archaeon]|jgi:5,10-methylenetetrahydrofolate reductase